MRGARYAIFDGRLIFGGISGPQLPDGCAVDSLHRRAIQLVSRPGGAGGLPATWLPIIWWPRRASWVLSRGACGATRLVFRGGVRGDSRACAISAGAGKQSGCVRARTLSWRMGRWPGGLGRIYAAFGIVALRIRLWARAVCGSVGGGDFTRAAACRGGDRRAGGAHHAAIACPG